jgi:LysM repeat protein
MRAFAILPLTILATACIPSIDQGGYAEADAPPRLETDNRALDVAPKSTWSSRQVSANAALVDGRTYVVQSGDTLRGIGNRTGAGSEVIARANGLEPPYIIRPGQRLIIPAGRYHTVASGETGIAIARAYSVSWRDVVSANAPPSCSCEFHRRGASLMLLLLLLLLMVSWCWCWCWCT